MDCFGQFCISASVTSTRDGMRRYLQPTEVAKVALLINTLSGKKVCCVSKHRVRSHGDSTPRDNKGATGQEDNTSGVGALYCSLCKEKDDEVCNSLPLLKTYFAMQVARMMEKKVDAFGPSTTMCLEL